MKEWRANVTALKDYNHLWNTWFFKAENHSEVKISLGVQPHIFMWHMFLLCHSFQVNSFFCEYVIILSILIIKHGLWMLVLSGRQWMVIQSVQWKNNVHIKLNMALHAYSASISKVKAGWTAVQGHPQLPSYLKRYLQDTHLYQLLLICSLTWHILSITLLTRYCRENDWYINFQETKS